VTIRDHRLHKTLKQKVPGSIPGRLTTFSEENCKKKTVRDRAPSLTTRFVSPMCPFFQTTQRNSVAWSDSATSSDGSADASIRSTAWG